MKKRFLRSIVVVLSMLAVVLLLVACDENTECTEHDYGDWVQIKAPTCTEKGEEAHYCKNCHHYEIREVAAAGQHEYINDICIYCGAKDLSSKGLAYTLNDDDASYCVSGMGTCTDTEIIIPSMYSGLPVTSIGENAFCGCINLTSVTIPDSVTDIGRWAFSCCWELTRITIPDSVTSIGSGAFDGCKMLTNIIVGNGVTSIGWDAFAGCARNLESITVASGNKFYHSENNCLIETESKTLILGCANSVIPANGSVVNIENYAFSYCSNLTSLAIPNSVTSIGYMAFCSCTSLTSITIPDSVTSIGDDAFRGCSSLTSVTIPGSVTSIGKSAFYGCSSLTSVTIGNGVTSIGSDAFSNTAYYNNNNNWDNDVLYIGNHLIKAQKTISGAYSVKRGTKCIANSAFSGCSTLTSVEIPDSVTSIGNNAFSNTAYYNNNNNWDNGVLYVGNHLIKAKDSICGTYNIKDGTKYIANSAFAGCSSLTSITIPNSVTSIGEYAFCYCSSLMSINVDVGNTVYHSAGNCLIETASKTLISGCANSVIPIDGSVTSIGNYAFYGCSSLVSITIPDSVTSIGSSAFNGCSSLTSITIPDSVTSISVSAFCYCSSFTSITISNSITSISVSAFDGCSKLTSITIPEGVTSIGEMAFQGCESLTSVTIPSSVTSIDSHVFRGCSNLASIMFNGTVEQWNAISKGSGWNDYTGSYTVYCTDGEINK